MEPTISAELTVRDLYDEYEARLHRYATSLARDADRADDLVQETLIRAMGNLPLLKQLNRYQRRAWLYRVLKNLFIDQERAWQRRSVMLQRLAWEAELASGPGASALVQELIELVPERYRQVLHMHHIQGQTSEEIGGKLGIPAATVRSRLFLARKWLKKHHPESVTE